MVASLEGKLGDLVQHSERRFILPVVAEDVDDLFREVHARVVAVIAFPPIVVVAQQPLGVVLLVIALQNGHACFMLVLDVSLISGIVPDRVDGEQDSDYKDREQEDEELVRLKLLYQQDANDDRHDKDAR